MPQAEVVLGKLQPFQETDADRERRWITMAPKAGPRRSASTSALGKRAIVDDLKQRVNQQMLGLSMNEAKGDAYCVGPISCLRDRRLHASSGMMVESAFRSHFQYAPYSMGGWSMI